MSHINLCQQEIIHLTKICERIHYTTPGESFTNHVYVILNQFLSHNHFTVDTHSLRPMEFKEMYSETLPSDTLAKAAPFMHEHPGLAQAFNPNGPHTGSLMSIAGPDIFYKTGLYNEVMRDLDVKDQVWIAFGNTKNWSGAVFCRDTHFTEQEVFMMTLIQPHVNIAWKHWTHTRELEKSLAQANSCTTDSEPAQRKSNLINSAVLKLSNRQREITEYISAGLSNQQIAEALNISSRTVAKHLEQIYIKVHVKSRTALAAEWNRTLY